MSKPVARSGPGAWHEPPPVSFLARRTSYPWMIVGTVCIGAFMGQLDASIAQLVLPELEIEFQARVSAVSWVAVAYLLTVAALLPIFRAAGGPHGPQAALLRLADTSLELAIYQ